MLRFEYPLMNAVMKIVKDHNLECSNQDFQMDCRMTTDVRVDKLKKVRSMFESIDGCRIETLNNENEAD